MARGNWRGRFGGAIVLATGVALLPLACARTPACEPPLERARFDFALKDMGGADVKLAAYKGRPLVINFWATWCGPCKQEIPALIELAERYKSKGVAILGISIDDPPEDLRKFAGEHKINYPVLVGLGHDDLLDAYDAQFAVPVSWFVTAGGCVSLKHAGPGTKDWFDQQIKALL